MVYTLNKKTILNLFRQIYLLRTVEETIAIKYPEGKMRCPVHLSIGQELIPAIFSQIASKNDFAVSTHRGHAHYLAKGGNLKGMISEIYGKADGCSKGKGGSMHLIDLNVNFMGTSAIVGNSIPVGVGLALSSQLKKNEQVSFIFLGDGAIEEGVFYESINFATLRNLPVIFICENNLYSVYSSLKVRQPENRIISDMVRSMGITSMKFDGKKIDECYAGLKDSYLSVKRSKKPCFLEFSTYRSREHCGPNYDDHLNYRSNKEVQDWQKNCPLKQIEKRLSLPDNEIIHIKKNIDQEINKAFFEAENSGFPKQKEAYTGVYA